MRDRRVVLMGGFAEVGRHMARSHIVALVGHRTRTERGGLIPTRHRHRCACSFGDTSNVR